MKATALLHYQTGRCAPDATGAHAPATQAGCARGRRGAPQKSRDWGQSTKWCTSVPAIDERTRAKAGQTSTIAPIVTRVTSKALAARSATASAIITATGSPLKRGGPAGAITRMATVRPTPIQTLK